jgi:hypothetical protein
MFRTLFMEIAFGIFAAAGFLAAQSLPSTPESSTGRGLATTSRVDCTGDVSIAGVTSNGSYYSTVSLRVPLGGVNSLMPPNTTAANCITRVRTEGDVVLGSRKPHEDARSGNRSARDLWNDIGEQQRLSALRLGRIMNASLKLPPTLGHVIGFGSKLIPRAVVPDVPE